MEQNKKKLFGLILAGLFLLLFLASIVLYISLGFFALATKILFIATGIALAGMIAVNWQLIIDFFRRRTKLVSFYKWGMFAVVIAVLVFLYLIAMTLPIQIDFTASRLYSFSDQTVEIVTGLSNEMDIYLFRPSTSDLTAGPIIYQETLLKKYASLNPLVTFEIVDSDLRPSTVEEYGVDEPGTVVVEYEGSRLTVLFSEIYDYDDATGGYSYSGEVAYTAAIKSLVDSPSKKAYFLTGHGELNWAETGIGGFTDLVNEIQDDGMEVASLNLLTTPEVLYDCGVLVIAHPTRELSATDLTAIKTYLDNGGSILMLVEYNTATTVNDILQEMGVWFFPSVVADMELSLEDSDFKLVPRIEPYPEITTPLLNNMLAVTMNYACYVDRLLPDERPEGYTYYIQSLLESSVNSYAEIDLDEIEAGVISQSEMDMDGPVPLAMASKRVEEIITYDDEENPVTNTVESRLVLIGDTTFVNNTYLNDYGNMDFVLNSINFLSKRDASITTRPKDSGVTEFTLVSSQKRAMRVLAYAICIIYLSIGIVIVVLRRRIVKQPVKK